MADGALLIGIIVIFILVAVLRRQRRKVKELRRSLKKAARFLDF